MTKTEMKNLMTNTKCGLMEKDTDSKNILLKKIITPMARG
jgi:hypothetical protein